MTSSVPDIQYPPLQGASEDKSAEQQRWFYWSTGLQLGALAASALLALLPADLGDRSGPISALILVLLALGIQISGVVGRSEQKWYEARAAAESVKSASWQFAMGGESFRIDDAHAPIRFRRMLADVLEGLPDLDIGTSATDDRTATSGMLTTRDKSLQERQNLYLVGRVRDQRHWYTKKAALHS